MADSSNHEHLVDINNNSVTTIIPTDCHYYMNVYIKLSKYLLFALNSQVFYVILRYFFSKYRYTREIKFLFRNNNFTSDFLFLTIFARENKFYKRKKGSI